MALHGRVERPAPARSTRQYQSSTMSRLELLLPLDPDVTLMWFLATWTSRQMPKDTRARRAKRTMMMMAMT